jgi:hypothetical protein
MPCIFCYLCEKSSFFWNPFVMFLANLMLNSDAYFYWIFVSARAASRAFLNAEQQGIFYARLTLLCPDSICITF